MRERKISVDDIQEVIFVAVNKQNSEDVDAWRITEYQYGKKLNIDDILAERDLSRDDYHIFTFESDDVFLPRKTVKLLQEHRLLEISRLPERRYRYQVMSSNIMMNDAYGRKWKLIE